MSSLLLKRISPVAESEIWLLYIFSSLLDIVKEEFKAMKIPYMYTQEEERNMYKCIWLNFWCKHYTENSEYVPLSDFQPSKNKDISGYYFDSDLMSNDTIRKRIQRSIAFYESQLQDLLIKNGNVNTPIKNQTFKYENGKVLVKSALKKCILIQEGLFSFSPDDEINNISWMSKIINDIKSNKIINSSRMIQGLNSNDALSKGFYDYRKFQEMVITDNVLFKSSFEKCYTLNKFEIVYRMQQAFEIAKFIKDNSDFGKNTIALFSIIGHLNSKCTIRFKPDIPIMDDYIPHLNVANLKRYLQMYQEKENKTWVLLHAVVDTMICHYTLEYLRGSIELNQIDISNIVHFENEDINRISAEYIKNFDLCNTNVSAKKLNSLLSYYRLTLSRSKRVDDIEAKKIQAVFDDVSKLASPIFLRFKSVYRKEVIPK